jgi:hypothetical protein
MNIASLLLILISVSDDQWSRVMKQSNLKSSTMRCISRVDDDKYRQHSWRVSLCHHGKRHVRNFPDKKWGSKSAALRIAKECRDQLLLKYPPMTRKEFCAIKRRNNKTGLTGVYTYCKTHELRDGTVRENWYWEANWPDAGGASISQCFSVKKFGETMAKRMATRARSRGMAHIEGTYWAAVRGEAPQSKSTNGMKDAPRSLVSRVA